MINIKFNLLASTIIISILSLSTIARGQTVQSKTFALSLGLETGLPTGNTSNYSTAILGGTVRLQYGISDSFAVTLTSGGYHFFSKIIPGTDVRYSSFGVGPVKAGVKEFFSSNIYIGAEAGVGVEVTQNGFSGGQDKLLLSPAVGYASKHLDIALHYESLTGEQNNYGIIGLRIAYAFNL